MGGSVVFLTTRRRPRRSVRANPLRCRKESRALGTGHRRARCTTSVSSKKCRTQIFPSSTRSRTNFIPARRWPISSPLRKNSARCAAFKLAYVGDGNNVCSSLIYLAARLGVHLRIATPAEYAPVPEVVADGRRVARETKAKIELMTDPREASAVRWPSIPIRGPAWASKPRRKCVRPCSNVIK